MIAVRTFPGGRWICPSELRKSWVLPRREWRA
jgi:hypothetical protein